MIIAVLLAACQQTTEDTAVEQDSTTTKKKNPKGTVEELGGTLPASVISKVVKRRGGEVKGCYESALKREPLLRGTIEVEFTIAGDGRVSRADVVYNGVASREVARCVESRVRRWRFPKPKGGSVSVSIPFVLSPS